MFSWICPKCGHVVPPAYAECPACAAPQQAPASENQAGRSGSKSAPPVREMKRAKAPRQKWAARMPVWLMILLFAAAFGLVGLGAYWGWQTRIAGNKEAEQIRFETPGTAAPEVHALTKHVEVTGLRLTEDTGNRASVQFVVVNHSAAEITGLEGEVQLKAVREGIPEETVGTFSFRIPNIAPYGIRNMRAPVKTSLRVYELPDWQFLRADLRITAP